MKKLIIGKSLHYKRYKTLQDCKIISFAKVTHHTADGFKQNGTDSRHRGPLRWKDTSRALCSLLQYLPDFCQHPLQLCFCNLQVFLRVFPDKGLKESCAVFSITPANSIIHQPANWPLTSALQAIDWGNGWRTGPYLHTLCSEQKKS